MHRDITYHHGTCYRRQPDQTARYHHLTKWEREHECECECECKHHIGEEHPVQDMMLTQAATSQQQREHQQESSREKYLAHAGYARQPGQYPTTRPVSRDLFTQKEGGGGHM